MIEEKLRGTGRTTIAINKVNELQLNGIVYFVVPKGLYDRIKSKFYHNKNVNVLKEDDYYIDWVNLSVRGSKYPVVFDHYVLYKKFSKILNHYFCLTDYKLDNQ